MTETDPELRYLLNRMDPAEREAFGARLLEDPELFNRVLDTENELYDGYARGTLTPGVRAAFEQTAGQRRKLTFARALNRRQRAAKPMRQLVAIAAGVVMLVGASTLLLLRKGDNQPGAKRSLPPVVAQFVLPAGATRAAAELPRLAVPADADEVELRMPLNTAPGRASVELRSRQGTVWNGELDVGQMAVLRVPARDLGPGLYELTVSRSGKPVGFASFYVEAPPPQR
jgi:hypothetical protein